MRVLVTGLGFISAYVIRLLVQDGHDVTVATRNTYAAKHRAVADVLSQVRLLHGDLAEPWFAEQCAQVNAQWVVHMAAETHVDRAISDPACFVRANVLGTTLLLQALTHAPPESLLVYSTDEVFGPTPPGQRFNEAAPLKPSNAYSASKVGVEAMAQAFIVTHGLPITLVRPCNTYGPGQHPEKVIPKFVRQLLQGEPVTLYNDGLGARDWLHAEDHARAVLTLLEHGRAATSYNLAAGDEHSDSEIATRIHAELVRAGTLPPGPAPFVYVPGRPGHDRRYWMDNRKLVALGWKPEIPFDDGFRATVLWNAAHQDWWTHDLVGNF